MLTLEVKSPHTFLNRYLYHMLVKFDQSFELFEKKKKKKAGVLKPFLIKPCLGVILKEVFNSISYYSKNYGSLPLTRNQVKSCSKQGRFHQSVERVCIFQKEEKKNLANLNLGIRKTNITQTVVRRSLKQDLK